MPTFVLKMPDGTELKGKSNAAITAKLHDAGWPHEDTLCPRCKPGTVETLPEAVRKEVEAIPAPDVPIQFHKLAEENLKPENRGA